MERRIFSACAILFLVLAGFGFLGSGITLHRTLGKVGVAAFAFLIVATVNLLLTAPATYPDIPIDRVSSEVAPRLIDLFRDTLFFGAAIALWRRPFVHKRLMFFVTLGISSTGFVRIPVIFTGGQSPVFGILLALEFAAALFAHDWRRYEGWKRWFIPLCFATMLMVTFGVTALLTPLVFSSEGWPVFLQGLA